MTAIILAFFCVLVLSFICSLFEAVLLSIHPAYVAVAVEQKKRSGLLLKHLTDRVDRPLSAILTLNTITNTVGSAYIASLVEKRYGESALTIVVFALAMAILFFSEIVPKSLGANHWKILAPFAAYGSQATIFLLYPFVLLIEKFSRNLRANDESAPEVSREEMIMTAEISAEEGAIRAKESTIIKNLLMLDKMYVADIMTPRSVLFALEAEQTVEDVSQKYRPIRFSRVPVYSGSLDNIIGMTHRYKILEAMSSDHPETKIGEISSPISSVAERMSVSQVLDLFIREKEHLVLATDEYGVVTGLVTLEDAVETLLGVEIVDEFDSVEDMRKFALEQWQVRKQKSRRS